ncbi:electron transfer flavoprotein subunit alpha/FixB family protein [Rhizobium mesoamericanum]|uniref:Electron transfer flavoprotein alpha subunit n=1 Tax=Rhizobium mesoamericanum STM3625 TaxID=1211777 RepID=K0Q4E1_9HYPH|nr:electron transfer flavoprotein subunit alpha/FixB family protein [Rhizobium mesoamericanum]CCM79985.1 Electron transfer flavoprotein alpha subunit [Rhizobium mesoamericanum STM3625]
MTNALFVLHHSADTRATEFGTLASLAASLNSAGYTSGLFILDTTAASTVTVKAGGVFRKISAVSAGKPVGDGADYLVQAVRKASSDSSVIVALGTVSNRNWGPQVAAAQGAEFLTACETINAGRDGITATAPALGGLVVKTVDLGSKQAVLLYSGEALPAPAFADVEAAVSTDEASEGRVRFVASEALPDTGGIPLRGASKVVAGGLGVGSGDKWRIIEEFAGKVDAAVGASRAAVEMGWVPSSRQVGFSGQKVSPDVYVAIGISGAVHHLAGIGGAKKIVAINKDPDASIFKVSDVAIVGDYEHILAAAMRKL